MFTQCCQCNVVWMVLRIWLHFAANQWNHREPSHNVASAVSFGWCWGYSCTCLVHWICFPSCLKACRLSNLICLDQSFWNYQRLCSYFLIHDLSKNMSILSTSSISTNLLETLRCFLAIFSFMSCQRTCLYYQPHLSRPIFLKLSDAL